MTGRKPYSLTPHMRLKWLSLAILACLLTGTEALSQTAGGKPSVAVVEFDVRYPVTNAVGRDLSDILVNTLVESQRFRVVDRTSTDKLLGEQKAVLSGMVDPATGAMIGKMTGAQFLVLASVTQFAEKKGGVGGFFGNKIPGASKVVNYTATVKINLRVINSTTGEIVFSKAIEKGGSNIGLSGGGIYKGISVTDSYESKAMQKAVEQAIEEAVAILTERIGSYATVQNAAFAGGSASTPACSVSGALRAKRVMVVIPEIHITQKIPDPAGETEIIRKLVNQGLTVIDQQQIAAIRDREKVLLALKNAQAAAALGAEFRADIIIIGEAFSELASRQNGMVTTRARVEARAIETDSARILAADGQFGSGLDIAEFVSAKAALRNAGSMWADYFLGRMCQAPVAAGLPPSAMPAANIAAAPAAAASPVEIMIAGISFTQLKQFGDRLEKIRGVQSVEKKLTGNVARIDVQYTGSAEKLADSISEMKFGLLRVNIVGLSGNKIEIKVGK